MRNICCPYLHEKLFTGVQSRKLEAASRTHRSSSTGGVRVASATTLIITCTGIPENPSSGLSDLSGSPPASQDHHGDYRETRTNTFQGALAKTSLLSGPAVQATWPDSPEGRCQSLLAADFDRWKTNEKKLSLQIPGTFYLVIQQSRVTSPISFSFHLDTEHVLF